MLPFMSPMMPMMSNPFMGNVNQPTPEQTAQMQKLALQNQQLQLTQMKQMLEQYAQSIDAALGQVEEQLKKAETREGADAAVQLPQVQAQFQTQAQAQGLSQQIQPQSNALALRARFSDPRFSDPRLFDPRVDPQNMVQGGMGDFGRPIF